MLSALGSLLSVIYSLLSALCSLLSDLCSSSCSLLSALCSLLSALLSALLCSLLSAHCSLLSFLLSALCSLPSVLCSAFGLDDKEAAAKARAWKNESGSWQKKMGQKMRLRSKMSTEKDLWGENEAFDTEWKSLSMMDLDERYLSHAENARARVDAWWSFSY